MINKFKIKDTGIGFDFDIELEKDKKVYCFIGKNGIGKTQHKELICDKPIVFIGAKNIDPDNIKILGNYQSRFTESIKRSMSYIHGEGLEHEEIANWFVSRLIINPNFVISDQNKSNEVITVLKLMEKLEPSLKLVIPKEDGNNSLAILYHEGQLLINNIPLDKLSTGFVSIIKIFQEIVAGYGGWSNIDDLNLVDGIVFIDELEPHLHISWQTKIISILKEFFPKTTFYLSTHSPLVLAGLKDGEAYELLRDDKFVKAKKIANIDNYFLSDIVSEFFGVDLNQNKIDNPDKEKQKDAKSKLLKLANMLQSEEK
jgi:predicted ATP-dependent endonuclease of OLD family